MSDLSKLLHKKHKQSSPSGSICKRCRGLWPCDAILGAMEIESLEFQLNVEEKGARESLEARVAELTAQRIDSTGDYTNEAHKWQDEAQLLRSRVVELERDRERLDWLERIAKTYPRIEWDNGWRFDSTAIDLSTTADLSIRAAIDAARTAALEEK